MATTTATITLSSADLTGDALSLSTTATLTKAGTVTGLTQFTGVGRSIKLTHLLRSEQMGKLYAGDWAFFPWEANADTNDIKIAASVSTSMTIEYALFIDE